ncbi:MAG: GAF domain-containing protein [Cyanobacteria bacterium J007]|nr:MAG: GAF domain-containing protein [Cyanobacteria bacterium J007]
MLFELLKKIISPDLYMPHGHCYLWQTPLVGLHVVSDTAIAIAYFSIPSMLIYFIYKRRDVPFLGIFKLFGAFIILCGLGHLLDVWTLWYPAYWLSGVEQGITALVSCYTAGTMVTLIPQFLSLKTPQELERINQKLQTEIRERQQAEAALNRIVAGTASVTGEAFFPVFVENLAKVLNVSEVFVARLSNSEPIVPIPVAVWPREARDREATPAAYCVAENYCLNPVNLETADRTDGFISLPYERPDRENSYCVSIPLLDNDREAIGILGLCSDRPWQNEADSENIVRVFAFRAAAELQRQESEYLLRRAYDEMEERVRRRTSELEQLNLALQQNDARVRAQQKGLVDLAKLPSIYRGDRDRAFQDILKLATRTLELERGSIWLYDEERSQIECIYLYERERDRFSRGLKLAVADYPAYFEAIASGEAVAVDDALNDPRTRDFAESYLIPLSIGSMLDVAIYHNGAIVGVICLETVGNQRHWTIEEQNFVSYLAYMSALTLEARDRIAAQLALQQRLQRERTIARILDRIRSSLSMDRVLETVVEEVRQYLNVDRVVVYRFKLDWDGFIGAEALTSDCPSLLGRAIGDPCFRGTYVDRYREGRIRAIADIHESDLTPCHVELLARLEVRANLVVPIVEERSFKPDENADPHLWGLLIAHQRQPRPWESFEIDCLRQLSVHLAIALKQCSLFEQMQTEIAERQRAEIALRQSESREREKAEQLEALVSQLQSTQAQIIHSEKMASLGKMVGGVAHEINNPVTFIASNVSPALNYLDALFELIDCYRQHYPDPPEDVIETIEAIELDFIREDFESLLGSIRNGADRIQKIVSALRHFSHLDEAQVKNVDLNRELDHTLQLIEHRLQLDDGRRAIAVATVYGDLPKFECYPSELNQVFIGLLENAIDTLTEKAKTDAHFTPKITVETGTTGASEGDAGIYIQIGDNGLGIAESLQSRIFDPFYTTKPVGSGTGLGLSIAHQIIKKHGGQLSCTSALDRGTTLTIALPRRSEIAPASRSKSIK